MIYIHPFDIIKAAGADTDPLTLRKNMANKAEYHELNQRIEELEKELESTRRILTQQKSSERCYPSAENFRSNRQCDQTGIRY